MSGRKNTLAYQVAANQSLSASFNTPPTIIQYLDNCSYQIEISTTDSTGTFVVQGSNDYKNALGAITPGNWVPLPVIDNSGNATISVSAANNDIMINLNQVPFTAIRLSYTANTPGTGTCNIFTTCKELGG